MSARSKIAPPFEVKARDKLRNIVMLIYYTNNSAQAERRARNRGYEVLCVNKFRGDGIGNIEKLDLRQVPSIELGNHPALAAEDRVFNRRKRMRKLENLKREQRKPIDK